MVVLGVVQLLLALINDPSKLLQTGFRFCIPNSGRRFSTTTDYTESVLFIAHQDTIGA